MSTKRPTVKRNPQQQQRWFPPLPPPCLVAMVDRRLCCRLVGWSMWEGRREEMGGASLCVFWSCDPAGEFKTKLMVMVPTILITTRHTAAQKC